MMVKVRTGELVKKLISVTYGIVIMPMALFRTENSLLKITGTSNESVIFLFL
jgi:hypothetical protein